MSLFDWLREQLIGKRPPPAPLIPPAPIAKVSLRLPSGRTVWSEAEAAPAPPPPPLKSTLRSPGPVQSPEQVASVSSGIAPKIPDPPEAPVPLVSTLPVSFGNFSDSLTTQSVLLPPEPPALPTSPTQDSWPLSSVRVAEEKNPVDPAVVVPPPEPIGDKSVEPLQKDPTESQITHLLPTVSQVDSVPPVSPPPLETHPRSLAEVELAPEDSELVSPEEEFGRPFTPEGIGEPPPSGDVEVDSPPLTLAVASLQEILPPQTLPLAQLAASLEPEVDKDVPRAVTGSLPQIPSQTLLEPMGSETISEPGEPPQTLLVASLQESLSEFPPSKTASSLGAPPSAAVELNPGPDLEAPPPTLMVSSLQEQRLPGATLPVLELPPIAEVGATLLGESASVSEISETHPTEVPQTHSSTLAETSRENFPLETLSSNSLQGLLAPEVTASTGESTTDVSVPLLEVLREPQPAEPISNTGEGDVRGGNPLDSAPGEGLGMPPGGLAGELPPEDPNPPTTACPLATSAPDLAPHLLEENPPSTLVDVPFPDFSDNVDTVLGQTPEMPEFPSVADAVGAFAPATLAMCDLPPLPEQVESGPETASHPECNFPDPVVDKGTLLVPDSMDSLPEQPLLSPPTLLEGEIPVALGEPEVIPLPEPEMLATQIEIQLPEWADLPLTQPVLELPEVSAGFLQTAALTPDALPNGSLTSIELPPEITQQEISQVEEFGDLSNKKSRSSLDSCDVPCSHSETPEFPQDSAVCRPVEPPPPRLDLDAPGLLPLRTGDPFGNSGVSLDAEAGPSESQQADIALKRVQRKAEAIEQRRLRHEGVIQRKSTSIFYLGKGVSSRLSDHGGDPARLAEWDLPPMFTPQELATALGLSIPRLRWLAYHTEVATRTHYITFTVPKKRGGQRTLSTPHRTLAAAQRWIFEHIVARLPVEPPAHGFCPGRSILSNAEPHVGQAIVINLDLKDFFPSITFPRIRSIFQRLGYSPSVATILALLCTECPRQEVEYAGQRYQVATGPRGLPQGACTSPGLSNQVARRLDRRLSGLAARLGIVYTRYADDLTFSGSAEFQGRVGYLLARVRHLAQEEGFTVHETKTRVQRRNTAQTVTGLVVNERPGIARSEVRRLRAILHQARHHGLAKQNWEGRPDFLAWLRGKIAYIGMVRPELGAKLKSDLEEILSRTNP